MKILKNSFEKLNTKLVIACKSLIAMKIRGQVQKYSGFLMNSWGSNLLKMGGLCCDQGQK